MSAYDYLKCEGFNAIFGDAMVAERALEGAYAWQYGQNTFDMSEGVTGTGAVSYADSKAIVSTGAGVGTARLEGDKALRYKPGFDGYVYFTTTFTAPAADTYQRAGIFTADNGYFVGYEGEQLQFTIRAGGVDIAIAFSNPASLDLTKLNIWRISYGYLGTAPVTLERYRGLCAGWVLDASYDKVGKLAAPHALNPSLPFALEAGRTSGTGAIAVGCASASFGRIGAGLAVANERGFSQSNEKITVSSGTLTNILTIRNKTTFNSLANFVPVRLQVVSAAVDGTKTARIFLYKNATLGGAPSYTDRSTANSVVDCDVAGTTVSLGDEVLSFGLGKTGDLALVVTDLNIDLLPGETLTAAVLSSGNTDCNVALRWSELF